jgi:hypothetical protein
MITLSAVFRKYSSTTLKRVSQRLLFPLNMFECIAKYVQAKDVYRAARQTAIDNKKLKWTAWHKCLKAEYLAVQVEFALDNPEIKTNKGTKTIKLSDVPWSYPDRAFNNPWLGLPSDVLKRELEDKETRVNELDDASENAEQAYKKSKSMRESAKEHKLRAAKNISDAYATIRKRANRGVDSRRYSRAQLTASILAMSLGDTERML